MGKVAGSIVINISAGTAQLVQDMDRAKAKVRDFGAGVREMGSGLGHTVSEVQATSGALRVLEGGLNNNLRAAERFLANVVGLGPALQAAFPIVGAVAFAGLLAKMGQEAYNFYKSIQEGPQKMADAFRVLSAPLRSTNDELALANTRLESDIAKLEGKRQNSLAIALAEARVAADKLADSLERDLDNIGKLLKEQSLSKIAGFFTGRASTSDSEEEFEKFRRNLEQIDEEGNKNVHAATLIKDQQKAKDEASKAQAAWNQKALDAIDAEIAKNKQLLGVAEQIQRIHQGKGTPADMAAYWSGHEQERDQGVLPMVSDQSALINARQGVDGNLQSVRDEYALRAQNTTLEQRKAADEAGKSNAQLDKPFEDRIKAMKAQLEGVRTQLAAVGAGAAEETIAKGYAAAQKAIEEVNKALERNGHALSGKRESMIEDLAIQNAQAEAELAWKTKLDGTTSSIEDRIQSLRTLTAAIGQGYEATKRASVETSVMGAVGASNYQDPQWMAKHDSDVASLRSKYGEQYDAERREAVANSLQSLQRQTDMELALAKAQTDGAEAVRQAALAIRLKQIAQDNDVESTKRLQAAETDKFNAERADQNAEALTRIKEETAATERMTQAVWAGAEAARAAALESKYAKMQREGASPEVIGAARTQDQAEHQEQLSAEAAKMATSYKDSLQHIDDMEAKLEAARATQGDTLQIEIALRDLENQRLQLIAQQVLQQGRMQDGVRAFFLDMQQTAVTSGKIIYDALHQALDRSSGELAKALTGQKTQFGKMFQDIGTQMLGSQIKSSLQGAAGALGKAFGIDTSSLSKPDGTKRNPFYVQTVNGQLGGAPPGAAGGTSGGQDGGLFGGGDQGGGIFSLLPKLAKGSGDSDDDSGGGTGSFFGTLAGSLLKALIPHAAGGDVSPSSAYLVGEQGPEILMGASGSMASNSESRRMLNSGGPGASYYIDARGTDPVQTEDRVRKALIAVHGSAVSTSLQASHDQARRVPQRS